MQRKVLMTKEKGCVWTWLLENEEAVEIHCSKEEENSGPLLGNIYIGKVQNIAANIGAVFIDIGGVNCYYDLSQAESAIFTRKQSEKKAVSIGDELVVQISREAVKTKAPTVTSNINFTGRLVVLTSGNTRIGVSSKLPKSLRDEWKERLAPFKNEDYGIIIRTNAKDASFEEITAELEELRQKFQHLKEICVHRTCYSCLECAAKPYLLHLKNVYTEGLEEIIIEDDTLFHEVALFLEKEQPEYQKLLTHYKDPLLPLSGLYNLRHILGSALNEKVWLKHGGYLVIQPTEALTVIDVNSGKCVSKKKQEDATLKMNLDAAKEIARQLRLRNLSGIILVDFINLDDAEKMQILLKEFRKYLSYDPIQATLVDVTELQLVEVTRKKVRKPLYECWEVKNE